MRTATLLLACIFVLSATHQKCGESVAASSPATGGTLHAAGRMNTERAAHTVTLLSDGRVLIAGGLSGASLSSAEVYDAQSRRFANVSGMGSARAGHTATRLGDGRVLI